ncbi:MAG: response regulator, partial [Selenomonas sp.]|nr:response regulator [Selenomonas sp.]
MQRVLIVEDEEIIRKGLVCTIDWAAMDCVVVGDAADGAAGLELLRTTHPDILLTDIRMPRMDGITMAEHARDEGILPQLIFLTSYAEFDYAKKAIELHAADYLLKPVNEEELAALLHRLAEDGKEKTQPAPLSEGLDWARYFSDEGLNPYVRHAMERIR